MSSAVEPITPRDAFVVTPNDSTNLTKKADGLWVGTGGDVAVITLGGTTLTFTVPTGGVLPLQVTRVLATGTSASGIRGLVY